MITELYDFIEILQHVNRELCLRLPKGCSASDEDKFRPGWEIGIGTLIHTQGYVSQASSGHLGCL